MKEKTLISLDGYYKDYKNNEVKQSEIIGIIELDTGIFKGIEIPYGDCSVESYVDLVAYICQAYKASKSFSLIAGYYNGRTLEYRGLLSDKSIAFGYFDLDKDEERLKGREKEHLNGKFTRSFRRPVNRYDAIIYQPQLFHFEGNTEITKCLTYLYELIEVILMKANSNSGWRGIQISAESIAPRTAKKTYMITPSIGEVK
ncbi:MAG: hypothetical protein HFH09_01830 [Bacilli bacterium]|nr:hypothetical protein [Bacilli bacterium]